MKNPPLQIAACQVQFYLKMKNFVQFSQGDSKSYTPDNQTTTTNDQSRQDK